MDLDARALHRDVGDSGPACLVAQAGHGQKALHRLWNGTVAVLHLLHCLLQVLVVLGRRQLAVDLETQALGVDVGLRNVRVDRQVDADFLRPLVRDCWGFSPGQCFEGLHGFAHEADVEVEAHPGNVAGLLRT